MARDQRTNSTRGDDDRVTKEDMWCCCIFFYPRCLQRFTSLNLFIFWVCSLLCFSAAALAVFEGLVTTIETRYQLSASEIGLSASMYTVGVVISTVIVTHFGGRSTSSRPVWIALGGVLLALGAFCHTLPQFILPPYQIPGESNSSSGGFGGVCRTDGGEDEGSCEAAERQILQDNNVAFLLIIIGQVILGLGYGPLVPLALAYVDDNASRGTTGLASGEYSFKKVPTVSVFVVAFLECVEFINANYLKKTTTLKLFGLSCWLLYDLIWKYISYPDGY